MSVPLSARITRLLALVAVVYVLGYLVWRSGWTLNLDALAFALLLFVAELQDSLSFFFFVLQAWKPKQEIPTAPRDGLRVDVYVPTYNEDLDVLEATLAGCNSMTYPHTTYVLDDGRRSEVAALAKRLGCRYLSRPTNEHAKAGNLNAALARTDGEFVAVFDADVIPQPDFLDRTLGYFADESVALVQLPQEFYNLDSLQHARGPQSLKWHEQSLFFRVLQPGRNHWNAAFWCGSPSIVRRKALEDVGGVATDTVTEDIHTTIKLHSRGWKTTYHNEVLAFGIAPQTLHAFAVQRLRWAQGSLQILRTAQNPFIAHGLSLAQRLNYIGSVLHFAEGYQDLLYVVTPVVVLLTGVWPLSTGGLGFVAVWFPFVALKLIVSTLLSGGYYRLIEIEQFSLLRMFTLIRASWMLVGQSKLRFRVTPKGISKSVYGQERRQVLPHMAILGALLVALGFGIHHLISAAVLGDTETMLVVLVPLLWAAMHAALIAGGVLQVLRRAHHRQNYRFPVKMHAALADVTGTTMIASVEDLSAYGCGIVAPMDVDVTDHLQLTLPMQAGARITLSAAIAHRGRTEHGEQRLGLRFEHVGEEERQRLMEYLFVHVARNQGLIVSDPAEPELVPARAA